MNIHEGSSTELAGRILMFRGVRLEPKDVTAGPVRSRQSRYADERSVL